MYHLKTVCGQAAEFFLLLFFKESGDWDQILEKMGNHRTFYETAVSQAEAGDRKQSLQKILSQGRKIAQLVKALATKTE